MESEDPISFGNMQFDVSIPFKRESSWKGEQQNITRERKCGFNSLQTGKFMESANACQQYMDNPGVSIPFKRESSWKAPTVSDIRVAKSTVSIPFKRESSWKGIKRITGLHTHKRVSIPFKRESSWKGTTSIGSWTRSGMFQFPSNGKVHGKFHTNCLRGIYTAPPFQFPSNGKVHGKITHNVKASNPRLGKFQFPSNGKVHGKKGYLAPTIPRKLRFNSLQTGKFMEREVNRTRSNPFTSPFQFPSNGKVHGKAYIFEPVTIRLRTPQNCPRSPQGFFHIHTHPETPTNPYGHWLASDSETGMA